MIRKTWESSCKGSDSKPLRNSNAKTEFSEQVGIIYSELWKHNLSLSQLFPKKKKKKMSTL